MHLEPTAIILFDDKQHFFQSTSKSLLFGMGRPLDLSRINWMLRILLCPLYVLAMSFWWPLVPMIR